MQSSFLSRSARASALASGLLPGLVLGAAALLSGCGPAVASPDNGRPEGAEKWFRRAQTDFTQADFDDAHDAIAKASQLVPEDIEVKTLAAKIALSSLDYAEVLRLLKGVRTSDAAGLRGRALWYKGELEAAADELDAMLTDPEVKDEWAKSISKLARRGAGRTPFVLSGGMLAAIEMVHVSQVAPYFIIPIEIDGESALAMLATGSAEVVLDSATRPEPSWVSLRLGQRLEVHDVPALAQDLSGISKEVGAPIKALLGVNLLRHVNATIDYEGRQFVARTYAPPPPPSATRLNAHYVRGGGMIIRGTMGGEKGPATALLVDTSRPFPLALDAAGWVKAGTTVDALKLVAGDPEQKLREGIVPLLRLGAFDVPRQLGISGVPIADLEKAMGVDLDGVMGAGLLYQFRCTFGDDGRVLWIEDDSDLLRMMSQPSQPEGPSNGRDVAPELPPSAPALPPGRTPAPAPTPAAPKKK
ncbi:MAG: hypothetical protein ABJE95_26995 [Byssovorax sp.]